jgi:multidrug efflux pump subunit AcrA (membrane-fusion protein)
VDYEFKMKPVSKVRAKKFPWRGIGGLVVALAAATTLWVAAERQTSSAQEGIRPTGPLISRGYTEAPAGTVTVAGNPMGGTSVIELRIKDGQQVKRDEIIAVLSNFPAADIQVRMAEQALARLRQMHDAVLMGTRVTQIALQENSLHSSIETNKLAALTRLRSGIPNDQKEMQASLEEQSLEREKVKLELAKQTLNNELAQYEIDLANSLASLENARGTREESLVRSPLDGLVVEIFTRAGERVSNYGIAKVVDMSQLRVRASVDELHLARMQPGARVEITFKNDPVTYTGRIVRQPLAVTRMVRSDADLGELATRLVEVEIAPDEGTRLPQYLGREARVTFLN